jgi:segregation and condensation protein B
MDETEIKHVIEAALLAAGRPLTLDRLTELFASKGDAPDRVTLKRVLDTLAAEYEGRGIELREVATGYRVQVKRSMSDWLQALWEERAPRYTRALLETLALIAYRQPITRAEIEEVRGVVVSTNIIRTLLERNWVRVVGHRDVPGKPAMFGTTKDFLDYFGLKKLEDLPPLAELKDGVPELSPQTDFVESLAAGVRGIESIGADEATEQAFESEGAPAAIETALPPVASDDYADAADEEGSAELDGPDLVETETETDSDDEPRKAPAESDASNESDVDASIEADNVIPLRAANRGDAGGE